MMRRYSENTNIKAIATSVLILLIVYFVIRPISVNTYSKYLQVRKYSNDVAILEKNLEAIGTIKRITKDYAEEIKLVQEVIPTEAREKDFLKDLSILCANNSVNLTNVSFVHFNDSIEFGMALDGRYENVVGLLTDINNMLRLTNISSLSVSGATDGPDQGIVVAKLGGKIFKKPSEL
jgi:hypothetical protein